MLSLLCFTTSLLRRPDASVERGRPDEQRSGSTWTARSAWAALGSDLALAPWRALIYTGFVSSWGTSPSRHTYSHS